MRARFRCTSRRTRSSKPGSTSSRRHVCADGTCRASCATSCAGAGNSRPTTCSAATTWTASSSAATGRCRCRPTARISGMSRRPSSRRSAMRSACSSSAAILLLLALAGCGGHARAVDPYGYDHSRPLAVSDAGVALSGPKMTVHVVTYAGVGSIRAFVVVPRSARPHPAVLLLHGSGGSREDLLLVAAELAGRGIVAMTISQPNDAASYRPLVVNARRALDVLAARTDVDAQRLGVVGFSLGAQTAAILAGDDPRLKAAGIISG